MTQSTDGQICYGIAFEEGIEFPWGTGEYENDIEEWWLYCVLGFRPPFEMFTPLGDWIGGRKWPQEKIDEYFGARREFIEANPRLPVLLIKHCGYGYPMYILAVPNTYREANRGYPLEFTPSELRVTEQQRAALIKFCNDHEIEFDKGPAWYLSSYWG